MKIIKTNLIFLVGIIGSLILLIAALVVYVHSCLLKILFYPDKSLERLMIGISQLQNWVNKKVEER